MARTVGSRNQDYENRRQALILLARERLAKPGNDRASFRDLAAACGVSVPTLRHYFPRREDLIMAVMAQDRADGEVHLQHMRSPQSRFDSSIREALSYIALGFSQGVGEMHALGLAEGLDHGDIGPCFVDTILEPSLAAVRERLDVHVARGEMRPANTRHAALMLLAPVTLLMLHQKQLGGADQHPIDTNDFLDDLASSFALAHKVGPS